MVRKILGSAKRPLPIRLVCQKGDGSSLMRPAVLDAIGAKRNAIGPVKVFLGGKEIYVDVSVHGFAWEKPERRISTRQLRGPGVVIAPYAYGNIVITAQIPSDRRAIANALAERYDHGRVIRTQEGAIGGLYPHGLDILSGHNPLPLQFVMPKTHEDFMRELTRHVKQEIILDRRIRAVARKQRSHKHR